MRACWEDPVWRAKQLVRIAKANGYSSGKRVRGKMNYVTLGVDNEMRELLRAKAIAQNTSMPELIRTYIQWGLDNEPESEL